MNHTYAHLPSIVTVTLKLKLILRVRSDVKYRMVTFVLLHINTKVILTGIDRQTDSVSIRPKLVSTNCCSLINGVSCWLSCELHLHAKVSTCYIYITGFYLCLRILFNILSKYKIFIVIYTLLLHKAVELPC